MLVTRRALRFGLAGVIGLIFLFAALRASAAVTKSRPLSKVRLRNPGGVFVDRKGDILVASSGNNSVVLFENRPGNPLREGGWASSLVPFGVIESPKGPTLKSPGDVAVDSRGRILVADTGNDAVKVYPAPYDSAERPDTIGGRRVGAFSAPEGVAVDEQDNILVFDTGNAKVRIFSSRGKELAVLPDGAVGPGNKPPPLLRAPVAGCYLGRGYVAIADRGVPAYSLWRYDPGSPGSSACRFVGYGPPAEDAFKVYIRDMGFIAYNRQEGALAYVASNFPLLDVSYLYLQAVDLTDPEKLVRDSPRPWLRVPLVGWLTDPAGVAFSPQGDLYITDSASDSLQKISRQAFGDLNTPVQVEAGAVRGTLEYSTPAPVPTVLQYGVLPGVTDRLDSLELPLRYKDPEKSIAHEAFLTDLLPSTRYAYRYLLSEDFYSRASGGAVRNFSPTRSFAMRPASRTMLYLDFPLTVLLFTNVWEVSGDAPEADSSLGAEGGLPSSQQIEDRVRSQLEKARLFFWVNSRMTCNIRFDPPEPIVVRQRLEAPLLPPLRKGVPEIQPLRDFLSRLEGLVEEHTGRDLSGCRNLLMISCVRSYDPALGRYVVRSAPSITCGLPYLGGAISMVQYADGDGTAESQIDQTWCFTAECYEQLSILHLASGNQASLRSLLGNPGSDFSLVTWDSLADPLRALGRRVWLSNRYGSVRVTRDEDVDGIPDDEPGCPLDEKRFGTSPRRKDTDGDEVNDLNEILASRWAVDFPVTALLPDGTSERTRAMENLVVPLPSARDTDSDGLTDGEDKNPLCPLADLIPKGAIALDGTFGAQEWEGAASMPIQDSDYSGVLYVAWSDNHLCFALVGERSDVPPSIRIGIDGAADGLLRGSDNLTVILHPQEDSSFETKTEAPRSGFPATAAPGSNTGFDSPKVVAAWGNGEDASQVVIEVGLEKSASLGLHLFPGEEVAFDFELRASGSPFWVRLFEPLLLFRGKLVESADEAGTSQ